MDIGKLKPDNAKAIAIILVVVVVLAIGGYFLTKTFGSIGTIFNKITGAVGNLTDGLGITTPKNVQDAQAAAIAGNLTSANAQSPFSPNLYMDAPTSAVIDPATTSVFSTNDLAKQVWDSVGFFSTDGQSALAAIKGCSTKAQVSYLAYIFNVVYSKDLYDFLSANLVSNSNVVAMQQIIAYVNSLPQY